METLKKNPLLLAAITAAMVVSFAARPAFAEDAADAVQALTDAITEAASGTGDADAADDISEEGAADAVAGLPKFGSRQERHEYFRKLREEDPERFKEVMEKRRAYWVEKHPGQDGPRGPRRDFRENRWDAGHGPDRGRPGRHPGRGAGYRS